VKAPEIGGRWRAGEDWGRRWVRFQDVVREGLVTVMVAELERALLRGSLYSLRLEGLNRSRSLTAVFRRPAEKADAFKEGELSSQSDRFDEDSDRMSSLE